VEILLSTLNEKDTSQSCDSHPSIPVDAFQKRNLPTKRNSQNPKENLRSEGESLFSVPPLCWGARWDEQRAQHPPAASLTSESTKPASRTGFLPRGSIPLC